MNGCLLFIFGLTRHKNSITKVSCDNVKFGNMMSLSTKGAVAIKFLLNDTLICFINSQLEINLK
jgi:hypothetical protein